MAECSDSSFSNNSNSQIKTSVQVPSKPSDDDKTEKDTVMDPQKVMIVAESAGRKVPQSFNNLRDTLGEGNVSAIDVAVSLVHLLVLEQGFINLGSTSYEQYLGADFHYQRVLCESLILPKPFKLHDGLYEINYQLGPFFKVPCKLIVTKFDSNIVLNGHIPKLSKFYSIMIDTSSYIVPANNSFIYQNMFSFSRLVKTNLCFRMKNDILRANKIRPHTINNLPEEMINHLRTFLAFQDDKNLLTCIFGEDFSKTLKASVLRKPYSEIRWSFSRNTF